MITIHLKLFASMKDICGFAEKKFTYDNNISVKALIDHLTDSHPEIADKKEILLIAVNEAYTVPETILNDGDVVAIFPPVSGG
ncbi:MAG TPA: molybdopterin converting factor subunit 1 [Spirochaetota bacterium]|nr:molybdopterin converting factor subunit 1 [Spirochaetota bacterium]HPJ34066.1 molybdopterin converting factor subunit 1 [Spirochaetota bacterium]